ncbi:GNAT family N-acetyltransferase [Streptomyces sp. NBC_01498]|uniref:GNAT family N-acetyltransferase n=1 Tax=Streptomyces sp. NBC_01498 TaxID=2975870 RepID=UPI002E7B2A76|nr:GNAT family N-acetyltransferase [Streptomyces sp. NBC_01498]WTL24719.1 GNAT family N-acetyltransferase [Streptomyces sp. NBC_01498]
MFTTPLPLPLPAGEGLQLREWTAADVAALSALFDDPEMDRWTPLRSPFDQAAARAYLAHAVVRRAEGRSLQLAVTTDGRAPLGEVMVSVAEEDGTEVELAYGIGAPYRRRGLASRAVRLLLPQAFHATSVRRAVLRIEPSNEASAAVARTTGFRLSDDPLLLRENNGRTVELATWELRREAWAAG